MSDLFDIPETLSPRLKWMREHGIVAQFYSLDSMPPKTGWQAWVPMSTENAWPQATAFGDTEDEAIVALAKKLNLKLWNE